MTNTKLNDSTIRFLIHVPSGNIDIIIKNNELYLICHWATPLNHVHDSEKNPNWKYAENILNMIYKYDKKRFIIIAKLLKKDSNGYSIIKKIISRNNLYFT